MTNSLLIKPYTSYNLSMHIGIDSRLPYYQGGGISKYVQLLIKSLAEIDEINSYSVFHHRKDDSSYIPDNAGNFMPTKLWTPCHHRLERWSLGTEIIVRQLDLFHSPDFIPPAFGARRRVITVHDLNFVYYPELLTYESRRYYLDQIDWAVRSADHISADSENTKRDLISLLKVPEEKISTVYLAADPLFAQNLSKESIRKTVSDLNLPSSFILFVGTLSPRKNLSHFLSVYIEMINEREIDIPFVIVGAIGWLYQDIIEQIDQLKRKHPIFHIDNANDVQLSHIYSAAAMLVLPSLYEGFGFPVLEAMHCGCPVIASNRGSLPEIVGSAGIIIDPEDKNAWKEAVLRILSDSAERLRMVQDGYLQAEQFTWTSTAEQTLHIYESLL